MWRDRRRRARIEGTADEDADAAAGTEPDVDARECQEAFAEVVWGTWSGGGRDDAGLGEPLS